MRGFRTWRYRRFHSAYGLAWMSLGLLCGIGLSQVITLRSWAIMIIALLVMLVSFARLRWYMIAIGTLMSVIVGIVHGSLALASLHPLVSLQGQEVVLHGVVVDDPVVTARGDTQINISSISQDSHHLNGSAWMTLRGERALGRGDTILVSGKAKQGFGPYQLTFSYPDVLSSLPSNDPMTKFRDEFVSAVRRVVIEPAASLGVGFVVGQKSALPHQLEEQLRVVGLTHLIVASGYNLTILVRAAKRLFEKRSKFLVLFATSFMTIGFIAISGASPSMTRAGMVAGLSIAAWYYGRAFHPIILILYVAALTAIINPMYVWADVGWWLSFLAFAGVLVVSPMIVRFGYRSQDKKPNGFIQILCETVSAQIMTLPFILLIFGKLPLLSIVANILSAPLIPLAMLLTTVAGLGAIVAPWMAQLIALPAEILLSYFIAIVRFLASPSWSQIEVSLTSPTMIALYGMLAVSAFLLWKKTKFNFRSQSIIE